MLQAEVKLDYSLGKGWCEREQKKSLIETEKNLVKVQVKV